MTRAWVFLLLTMTPIPLAAQENAAEVGLCDPSVLLQDATDAECPWSSVITCGATRSGALDTDDCVRHSGGEMYYWDPWYFTGTAGQTVTIRISSSDFDPFVELFDPSGAYAAQPDDFEPGVERRSGSHQLQYRLRVSGTWMILATSFLSVGLGEYDHVNVLGRYSVSLSCADLGLPNLVPYKPAGWSDKIVVSTEQGGKIDAVTILPTDRLYLSWAIANVGTTNADSGSVPEGSDIVYLYIDGTLSARGYCGSCADNIPPAGYYAAWSLQTPKTLPVGTHQLRLVADPLNLVPEGDETDNEYIKTVIVAAPPPPLIPRMPVIRPRSR